MPSSGTPDEGIVQAIMKIVESLSRRLHQFRQGMGHFPSMCTIELVLNNFEHYQEPSLC